MHKMHLMAAFFVGFISTVGNNAQAEQNEPSKEKKSVKSLKIENVESEFLGKINIEEATGYSGNDTIFFNLLSKGDIDNDGFDDLVIALHRHDTTMTFSGREFEPSGAIKPIVLFYNEKTDNYSVSQQLQSVIADNEHARQASIQDFDGDGRKDIFIADHGYDDAPMAIRTLSCSTSWRVTLMEPICYRAIVITAMVLSPRILMQTVNPIF